MKYLILILPVLIGCAPEHDTETTTTASFTHTIERCHFVCTSKGLTIHHIDCNSDGSLNTCECE